MLNRFEHWMEDVYDFVFILAVCIFGFAVQIGYMYLKDKIIARKKIIVLFIVNLSVSNFINRVMKGVGWDNWIWVGIWFYNANSMWILETIGSKLKASVEKAVPGVVESWIEKFKSKPKNSEDGTTP